MSHPLVTAKAAIIAAIAAIDFSGNGNVVGQKLDTFEKPGAAVHLTKMTSERGASLSNNDGMFDRAQMLQVTVSETFSSGDTEDQLLALALEVEAAIDGATYPSEFTDVTLAAQQIEVLTDNPSTGVITQVYSLEFTQTLT